VSVRYDGRAADELRPFRFTRDFTNMTMGSCLVEFGETRVLCTASVEDDVPRWLKGKDEGWVTAEYSMLPGSSPERINRERRGPKGRTQEIERLIGRSLRAVTDLTAMPETSIRLDCDVLQADGGTRTASICGAYVALHDAVTRLVQAGLLPANPLATECVAISVGIVNGQAVLDLPYPEDANADVDFNVIMDGNSQLIEVQGTAEGNTFSRSQLDELLDLAEGGVAQIVAAQREVLASPPSPRTPGR